MDISTQAEPSGNPTAAPQPNASAPSGNAPQAPTGSDNTPATGALSMEQIFGDDYKDPSLAQFKDPKALAKSFIETKKLVGSKFISPDAVPEADRPAFYKALGVPDADTLEAYGLEAPKDWNAAVMGEYDVKMLGDFAKIAKAENLTPKQAKAVQAFSDKMTNEMVNKVQEQLKAVQAENDKKLDALFTSVFGDKKGEASAAVAKTIQEISKGNPEISKLIDGKLNDEALAAIALIDQHYKKTYGREDSTINDGGDGSAKLGTEQELRDEAKKLMTSEAYRNGMHKDHKETVAKVNQLYKDAAAARDAVAKK